MKYFQLDLLLLNLDVKKFRLSLLNSIGGEDGLTKKHLKLTDIELLTEYLSIYNDLDGMENLLKSKGEEYYHQVALDRFGSENRDNSRKNVILIGMSIEHTSEYDD